MFNPHLEKRTPPEAKPGAFKVSLKACGSVAAHLLIASRDLEVYCRHLRHGGGL
jgi:hypothetical protein